VIHINTGVWPTWAAADSRFPALCREMVHEYGHLEGYPDVGARRGSVEYERPDLADVPVCESYRLVLGSHGYTAPPPGGRSPRRPARRAGRPSGHPHRPRRR